MGVAALDFPKGLEFSNSHQFFYIPSRNISSTQTFIRNLFTLHRSPNILFIIPLLMYQYNATRSKVLVMAMPENPI